MEIKERLSALRKIMDREGLDAYIVSGTDPHNSEYLPAAWQQRRWISGFTGSYGTVVVTKDDAGLWTDTRYFIQAAKELNGTGIQMHKLRVPEAVDYPEWLASTLPNGATVGVDGFCTPVGEVRRMEGWFAAKQIKVSDRHDLLGEIWLDRPGLPEDPVWLMDPAYTGVPASDKISSVRQEMGQRNADYAIFSCLDEIAWLYNIRGNDVPYNPLVVSYAVVGKEKAWFFVKGRKVPKNIASQLATDGIELHDYHQLLLFIEENKGATFCIDTSTMNYAVYNKVKSVANAAEWTSPVVTWKAVKNEVEIEGFRRACVQDGIAMTRFLHWLEDTVKTRQISETEAAERLGEFRRMSPDCFSDSFHTISAYGVNAALPHYSAIPGLDAMLKSRGLYLVDSGGQYRYGTTDITRTVPLGRLTPLEMEDYTLVLKGMIHLDMCVFPTGTTGANIDIVARQPLWDNLRNFGHGTGHGIGHVLCVHEGPQDIRQTWRDQAMLPGMVTSDEPGLYREGSHGVRHENMMLCVPVEENEFGKWLRFETLTLCYFDTTALILDWITPEEKHWINRYNGMVYEKISPHLSAEDAGWLKGKTAAI